MNNIFKGLPESVAGLLYLACGVVVVLDAMHLIQAKFLVIIGGLFLAWHGFVLVQGPRYFSDIMSRMHRKK